MKLLFSSALAPLQLPFKTETHLWYMLPNEVRSARLLEEYSGLLSYKEKEDVRRMNGDHLKKRAILTRALVRTTLARYHLNAHVTPTSLKFRKNVHGKPEVQWPHGSQRRCAPLQFNVSHTDSMIVCAVTLDAQVGVDVEQMKRKLQNNVMFFAKRFFSPPEVDYLSAIPDLEIRRQELIKIWTLKEAYVKALGKGFSSAPFNAFTVPFGGTSRDRSSITSEDNASTIINNSFGDQNSLDGNWQFILLELAGSHFCAVCRHPIGEEILPLNLKVWRTLPFIEDECISTKNARA